MVTAALLAAVRPLRAAEPALAVERLVARLREQRPQLDAGAEQVGGRGARWSPRGTHESADVKKDWAAAWYALTAPPTLRFITPRRVGACNNGAYTTRWHSSSPLLLRA